MSPRALVIQLAEHAGVDVEDVLEYWGERAALREFDGGQDREQAETAAVDDIRELLAVGAWTFARKGPQSATLLSTSAKTRDLKG
jgi:hypothetical protein